MVYELGVASRFITVSLIMWQPHFTLKPSRFFLSLFIAVHLFSVMCLLLTTISIQWKILAILFLVTHGFIMWQRKISLRDKNAIVTINYHRDGEWQLQNRRGVYANAILCGDSVVTRWLIILNFKVVATRKIVSVIIFPDSVDTDTLRRLRVFLRN